MVQSTYIGESSVSVSGKFSSRRGMRPAVALASDKESNLHSKGIARNLTLRVLGLVMPITLIALFAIYTAASNQIELMARSEIAIQTETLLNAYEQKSPSQLNQQSFFDSHANSSSHLALLNRLDTLLATKKLDVDEKHYLISASGSPVEIPAWLSSARQNIQTSLNKDVQQLSIERLSSTPNTLTNTISVDGRNYLAVGMLITPMNWKYYRLVPQDRILNPIKHTFLMLAIAILFIGSAAVLIFEYSFKQIILGRLQSLTDAAKRLATGNPNIRVNVEGDDEISQMAIAFNKMAENFESHRKIESIFNQLEHDYLDGKKTQVLLDDACRELATIGAFPLVWVALQHDDQLQLRGAGGSDALEFRSFESSALSFCAEALKNRIKSYLHYGESPFPGAPTGQTAIFPLNSGDDVIGAMIFHAPHKTGFAGEHWNAMRYWSERLQHTLHVMENEREMLDVRLRMLQAQIEPHFLVNTLSNIITQVQSKPAQAKRMLTLLASYLRVSLARTRGQKTTLKEELEVLSVYLEIQTFRMPGRLSYHIQCADDLLELRFPPLLLQKKAIKMP